jgi:hypothetical protein
MTPGDTTRPVELWTARGRRILVVGPELPVEDRFSRIISEAGVGPAASETVRFSSLEQAGSHVRFWAIAPVVEDGTRLGFILQPRNVTGQREFVHTVREYMREDVDLYLRNADGSLWVAAPDAPSAPPVSRDSSVTGVVNVRAGTGRMLAEEVPIAGAPWVAVIEASESAIMGPRVYSAVRLLAGLSVLVVLVGAILSWFVGRRITRPLVQLAGAAESVLPADQTRSGDSPRASTPWPRKWCRLDASWSDAPAKPIRRAKRLKRPIDRRAISWR